MQTTRLLALCVCLASGVQTAKTGALVSSAGQTAAISPWDLQSSATTGRNLSNLSRVGLDTSTWHHVSVSKCTLIGCLLAAGVYNETELFYSDNLSKVDVTQFSVPWIYRNEFSLEPVPNQHFFLQTHGISSRADIFLNGQQVVSSTQQVGSYAGQRYDITALVKTENALAVQAYPTDYYRDFALGWVDWNPWPQDNGTGVWRDIEIKQTGPVLLEPLRVVTQLGTTLEASPANVTLKSRAHNLENSSITITAAGAVALVSGGSPLAWNTTVTLPPLSTTDIILNTVVDKPAIWWPRQWGNQPLYNANVTVTTADGTVSDSAAAEFGFRTVTRMLNKFNDTLFSVNGNSFQVIGVGYSPDIFLRWSPSRWESQLQHILDLGFNTVRLEGKDQHPDFYSLADRLGVMIMPGWECCDKWEAWSYNEDLGVPTPIWSDADYATANASMLHEAAVLQPHPSVLTFLIGSDYWPNDRATTLYLSALHYLDWPTPIVNSASARGYNTVTGPSGMRMDGPYDWVPPNYWFTPVPNSPNYPSDSAVRPGDAIVSGFNTELSPGSSTPVLASLTQFLSSADMESLWAKPNNTQFHMSRDGSSFTTRQILNSGVWARWGAPANLSDYLTKVQLTDYEAVRAQVEGFAARWGAGGLNLTDQGSANYKEGASRPATGMVYWMGNTAWPGLHWQLWDWYGRAGGAYYGAKAGARLESAVFDPVQKEVWVVNRALGAQKRGDRKLEVEILSLDGHVVYRQSLAANTLPNQSRRVLNLFGTLGGRKDVVFVRLVLSDGQGAVLSRNVYWVTRDVDVLDWANSNWFYTPVSKYANYAALNKLPVAEVAVAAVRNGSDVVSVTLENKSGVPAFFISLNLVDGQGADVLPLTWDDNYVTLWPKERLTLTAKGADGGTWEPAAVNVEGKNVGKMTVKLVGV